MRQVVLAEAGYAYGVIGADLHVFPGRGPAYLLANHAPASPGRTPAGTGLPAQPSYLLNARSAVVDFTGRRDEIRDLAAWRDSDRRLAAGWLHAPGGQGKTRLAGHLADSGIRDGWKVITADHAAGKVDARNPASQDLRIGAATGLLLVVDYADRWPLAHLTWLFSNKILNQAVPVRVLLLARTSHVWPALCHALVQAGWPPDSCTIHRLGPLPSAQGSRGRMFTAARDSFARRYRLSDPHAIQVPAGLERDEFGLTLAVHMAALVAVDRHARSAAQPPLEDLTDLTTYLLDRERHHWHTLYDTGASRAGRDTAGGRATFDTTPEQMSRVVFTAALTGPLGYRDAKAVLDIVGVGTDPDRVLADHTSCYPPTDPRTVLEPLYPDRLAEDFLALCLPGHHIPGPWAGAWADRAPGLLLTPTTDGGSLPPHASRTITVLSAASDRWPHLMSTLEALEPLLPDHTRGALTIAAADLTERLANHRLATTTGPVERALIYLDLGERLDAADRTERAESAFREAVRHYRALVGMLPPAAESVLALALAVSAFQLISTGLSLGDWLTNDFNLAERGYRWLPPQQHDEAMFALAEALEISRRLAHDDPAAYTRNFIAVADLLAGALILKEQWQEAQALVSAVLTHVRSQGWDNPTDYDVNLLAGLDPYILVLLNLVRPDEALPVADEAVQIARRLVQGYPDKHETDLVSALRSLARVLHKLKRHGESLHAMREAVGIARRLVQVNPAKHADDLRVALEALGQLLADQHRWDEALPVAEEAVRIARRLAQDDPERHEESLAGNLSHLANVGLNHNWREEDASVLDEAISIRRRLAQEDPAQHERMLCAQLSLLSNALAKMGRWNEALSAGAEAVEIVNRVSCHVQDGVERHLLGAVQVLADHLACRERRRQRPKKVLTTGFGGDFAAVVERLIPETASPRRDAYPAFAETIEEFRRRFAHDNPAGQLYRQLTGADPLAAESHLTNACHRPHATPEAVEEAAASLGHAVAVQRRQVELNPEYLPDLAAVLGAQAMALRSLGRHEEALLPACEATDIYLRLARNDPATYLPMRVTALVRTAVVLGEFGATGSSIVLLERAINSRRLLAQHDHAGHEPALAVELAIMARALAKLGRWAEAVASATESFEIGRRPRDAGLTSDDDCLTAAEEFLTTHLAEAELRPEFLAALRDAITARRSVGERRYQAT